MRPVARGALGAVLLFIPAASARAQLIQSEWNAGDGDWNVAANWSPVDVPDNGAGRTYAVQIGNRPVAAGAVVTYIPEDNPNDIVSSLIITGGAELYTNANHLNVFGLTSIHGANSKLRIGPHLNPHASAFFTHSMALSGGGALLASGGAVEILNTLDVNAGGLLEGPGELLAGDIGVHSGGNVVTSGMLHLDAATTQIDAGATFSGAGSLVIPAGSSLRLEHGADIGLLTQNSGSLSIGLDTAAQAAGLAYRQTASGAWTIDIHGTATSDFDQLNLTGAAQLAGALHPAIGSPYAPALGDAFNILSASSVTGQFASLVQPAGLAADLAFDVRYNPTSVQIIIVNSLPGDYNRDAIVDAADYVVWRKTRGQSVPIFTSADGNGDGTIDNDDFTIWRGNFGATATPGSGVAVPEAATTFLAMAALYIFGYCGRRYLSPLPQNGHSS
jgi:hypothetical protein